MLRQHEPVPEGRRPRGWKLPNPQVYEVSWGAGTQQLPVQEEQISAHNLLKPCRGSTGCFSPLCFLPERRRALGARSCPAVLPHLRHPPVPAPTGTRPREKAQDPAQALVMPVPWEGLVLWSLALWSQLPVMPIPWEGLALWSRLTVIPCHGTAWHYGAGCPSGASWMLSLIITATANSPASCRKGSGEPGAVVNGSRDWRPQPPRSQRAGSHGSSEVVGFWGIAWSRSRRGAGRGARLRSGRAELRPGVLICTTELIPLPSPQQRCQKPSYR